MKSTHLFLILVILTSFLTACKKEPEAQFTIEEDYLPALLTTNFVNNSVNADTYLWDFGDGGTSTNSNPEHIYQDKGTYTVRLTASGSGGENSTSNQAHVLAPANILPGESIGPYYLLESWGSIKTKVTSTSYYLTTLSIGYYYFHRCSFNNEGIYFFFQSTSFSLYDSDQVIIMGVYDPYEGYTREIINLDSKVDDVIAAYGQPSDDQYESLYYDDLGIYFAYDDQRNYLDQITIYEADKKKSTSEQIRQVMSLMLNTERTLETIER